MLSHRQFREVAANARTTGDSIHVLTGERPQTGYMVSLPDREQHSSMGDFADDDLVHYTRQHLNELSAPDQYLGVWPHKGRVYRDVSRRHPDLRSGMAAGWQANQIAIHRNADHEDIDVPLSPRDLPIWKT